MITTLDDLTPATRSAADAWLGAALAHVDAGLRDSVRDDLTAALCEGLDADATPADVDALAARIGPLEGDATDADPRVGVWHGLPYDWRPPTAERVKASLWDPADPRLLRPRAFGAGWDLNFGAAAVRLGLIEPDAEDEPFASTPREAFAAAAVAPVVLAGAVVAHYVVRGRTLPDQLPAHWNLAGRPDRTTGKAVAAASDIAVALGAAALGVSGAAGRTSKPARAGRLALAGAAGAGTAAMTVARSRPEGGWWVGPAVVGSLLGGAAGVLLGLAFAGRAAEQRRDLRPHSARP